MSEVIQITPNDDILLPGLLAPRIESLESQNCLRSITFSVRYSAREQFMTRKVVGLSSPIARFQFVVRYMRRRRLVVACCGIQNRCRDESYNTRNETTAAASARPNLHDHDQARESASIQTSIRARYSRTALHTPGRRIWRPGLLCVHECI